MKSHVALALLLSLLSGESRAAQSGDVRKSTLAWLERFISTAYPETAAWGVDPLLTLPAHRDWNGYLPFVSVSFVRATLGPRPPGAEEQHAARLLEIELVQDSDGLPNEIIARGGSFDLPRGGELRFGPANKDGMLRALALERFEPLLGKLIVEGAMYLLNGPDEWDKQRWQVNVVGAGGSRYVLFVEPVQARIVSLFRRSPSPADLRNPWPTLEHDTAWIFLADIDVATREWASNPKHEVLRTAPGTETEVVPRPGDVLRMVAPSQVVIVDYKRTGERERLRTPANRAVRGADMAGTLPVGAVVRIEELAHEKPINGLQGIWARVTPAGTR